MFPALIRREKIEIVHEDHEDIVEVVEYDDYFVYEDEHPYLKTLLGGIPDWRELEFSYLTVGLNILLALFTLDMVFRGPIFNPANDLRFSRVGFVDETSAKILVREPDVKQLPLYTYYKTDDQIDWREGQRIYYVDAETDYTHPIIIDGLISDTAYSYSLSNGLNGTFLTAPSASSQNVGTLTFLTSSCIKANFPYRPFSNSLAIHGFEHLSKLIQSLPSMPSFMLFLGDFIYIDVPQRLSSTFSHYRSEYRRVYASPSWNLPGLNSIPWIHTLDDHEIANDWSGGNQTAPFPAASDPFINYHVSVNPPIPPSSPSGPETNTTYFQFSRGPASFFMLDTRRYRTDPESKSSSDTSKPLYGSSSSSTNTPNSSEQPATMLGSNQLSALLTFLSTPEPPHIHWKILASSVPFTKNWRFGTSDTWGGFPTERAKILSAMHKAESTLNIRIIILSGDRHEFAAIRYPPPLLEFNDAPTSTARSVSQRNDQRISSSNEIQKRSTIYDRTPQSGPHEFSVGPLSMFYLPLRTFKQIDNQDVAIAYFPDGNSKVGVVSIQNLGSAPASSSNSHRSSSWQLPRFGLGFGGEGGSGKSSSSNGKEGDQKSLLKYSLYVDGEVEWEYTLTSPGIQFGGLGGNRERWGRELWD